MATILHGYPRNPRIAPEKGKPGLRSISDSAWTFEMIDLPGAWLIPRVSTKEWVSIIDVGFNANHQDLNPASGHIDVRLDNATDKNGHGTQVAGIIAARHNSGLGRAGVCPGASILSFNTAPCLDINLIALGIPFYQLIDRISNAVTKVSTDYSRLQCRVVNISKAGAFGEAMSKSLSTRYLKEPADAFIRQGGVIVVGTANEEQVKAVHCFPSAVKNVADDPLGILVVGSTGRCAELWNGGMEPCYRGQYDVDIYAPGAAQEVLDAATPAGYTSGTGNSLAIPHVSGLAALLLSIDPGLTGKAAAGLIRETAELQEATNDGEPVRVINAFAAALKAYNNVHPDQPLAGYRLSAPITFNEGLLEINGVGIDIVSSAKITHAFCRFAAPLEEQLHAKLFLHPDLETSETHRCYWEGDLQNLLQQRMSHSRNSAWTHEAVELHTIHLNGLAMHLVYDKQGKQPVCRARVQIVDQRNEAMWESASDDNGWFTIPFGEPGPYRLIVNDTASGRERYERDLELTEKGIYREYPPQSGSTYLVLDKPVPANRWLTGLAGDVFVEGDVEKIADDRLAARGALTLQLQPHRLTPEIFLFHYCSTIFPGDYELEDLLCGAEGFEPMSFDECLAAAKEMMPDLTRERTRVCSYFFGDLANGADTDWRSLYRSAFDTDEWYEFQDIPPGVVLAASEGAGMVTIDYAEIGQRYVREYFRSDGWMEFPCSVDLDIGFFVDYTAVQGQGEQFLLQSLRGSISAAEIPVSLDRTYSDPQSRKRIIAGPSKSSLQIALHPESRLSIEPDHLAPPSGCISCLVSISERTGEVQACHSEVIVLGANGEMGKVLVY